MTGQKTVIKPAKQQDRAAASMIDKIIGRCKADRRAIEMLDDDQKEYLRRNAKAFLAERMKKMKRRDK